MPSFAKTEDTTYPRAIVQHSHAPVTQTMPFTAVDTVLPAGSVVSYDDNNTLVGYDGTASPVGVLLTELDTTEATVGRVLVHGVVDPALITPNTAAALRALAQISIYA